MRRQPYIGTPEEYAACFREISLTEKQKAMLFGHAKYQVLSMREIARFANYQQRAGNSRYGGLARKIREKMKLPKYDHHIHALLNSVGKNIDGELNLRIHDEVVEGLKLAGLFP